MKKKFNLDKDIKSRIKLLISAAKTEISRTKSYLRTAKRNLRILEIQLECEHSFDENNEYSSCSKCAYIHVKE